MTNSRFQNFFLACLCFLSFLFSSQRVLADDFVAAAEHAISIEVKTGKVLYAKDADTPDAIASITKILTAYIVYQEISEGRLSLTTEVNLSDYPYELLSNPELSNVPMESRRYTVLDLLEALMISSSNSAAIALAEHISGSEPAFVDRMKQQLTEWGITDAKLVNASGLPNSYLGDHIYPGSSPEDENMMSAKDVAIIAQHLTTDYPEVLSITSLTSTEFAGTTITTHNTLLEGQQNFHAGVTGLKSGTTALSGDSFVATANENGMSLITVVLNADNPDNDPTARYTATSALLDYVANTYQPVTLVQKGQAYKNSTATVFNGEATTVRAVAKEDLTVVITKATASNATAKVTLDQLDAPVAKNNTIGTLSYEDASDYLVSPPQVDLVAEKTVVRSPLLKIIWNHLTHLINNLLNWNS